jgi:alkanesulfonate monooxygenase SsuD/methylene tetrahydromethanopterin reductase-like flavin-dependent oxidoreductase (luciferase family)
MDPHSTHVEIGRKFEAYRSGLAAAGHSPDGRTTPIARLIAVAPTDEEAREVARRGAQWTVDSYVGAARRRNAQVPGPAGAAATGDSPADLVERYVNEVIIHGSPARVADELTRLREEIGLDYLLCAPLSHQSFLMLTEQVIPAMAKRGVGPS